MEPPSGQLACHVTMKNPPTQANSTISITTPLGPDVLLLRSFTFQEELGRPFVLRAELQSTDDSLPLDSLIGQNAVIQINLPTYQQRYINGYISTFQQVGYSGELAEYRATIVPWLGLLAQTSNCRIFQNLSTTSIVQQVCAEAGFSDIQINFAAVNYPLIPFCVQYNETALDFVCRLLEEAGLYFYFSSTINSCTMVICDSTSKAPVFPGYEVIPYSPRTRGPAVNFEHIYEWVIEKEAHPVKFTVNDYNYTTTTTRLRRPTSLRSHWSRTRSNRERTLDINIRGILLMPIPRTAPAWNWSDKSWQPRACMPTTSAGVFIAARATPSVSQQEHNSP